MQDNCPASRSLSDRGTPTVTSRVIKLKGAPPGSRVVRAGAVPALPRVALGIAKSEQPACLSLRAGSIAQLTPPAPHGVSVQRGCSSSLKKCAWTAREAKGLVQSPTVQKRWAGDSTAPCPVLLMRPEHHSLLGSQAWAPPAPPQAASRGNLWSPHSTSHCTSCPLCAVASQLFWNHIVPCYFGSEYTPSIHLTNVHRASALCQVDGDE